jgi:hypothetical protein
MSYSSTTKRTPPCGLNKVNAKAEEFATETRAIINDFMDFVDLGGLREPGGPSWEEFGEDKSRSKTWTEIHRRTRNELRRLREGLGAEFHRGLS